jgi:hypothetical protein
MPTKREHRWRARGALIVGVLALTAIGAATDSGPLLLGGGTAEAVIGRPLTPVSYAGVARRTTRRAAYAGAAYGSPYYAAPVASTTVVTTLPTGCAGGGANYTCGSVRYAPVYNGTTVVYRRY